jgi:hypothetical protein
VEEEWARGVDPTQSGRQWARHRCGPSGSRQGAGMDLTVVEAWSQSRSGHAGGDKMIPPIFGFKGQPCN